MALGRFVALQFGSVEVEFRGVKKEREQKIQQQEAAQWL